MGGSCSNTSSPAPATMPLFDRAAKRRFVDQLAARRVDEPQARLAARKAFVVEQMPRFGRRRQVQREVVGGRAQRVERQQLDAEAGGDLLRDVRIVGDDAHAERPRALRDLLADPARARRCRASCRAARCRETLLFPAPVLHRAIGGRDRARQRQHQRAGVLGDADAVGAGRVDDEDAARAGGRDVDVVHAGAGAGDDPQLRRGSSSRASTFVALRTISASASARSAASAAGVRPERASTTQPASARSSSSAEAGRSSAMTIFNVWVSCRVAG